MRIKHFAGYGSVNAKVVFKTNKFDGRKFEARQLVIRVWGDHERGLDSNYHNKRDIAQWLGKVGKFLEEEIVSFRVVYVFDKPERNRRRPVDTVEYVIDLRDKFI